MALKIMPVPCPHCGEAQNVTPGGFDPEAEPFGPVSCMVCGRKFTRDEYLSGLKARLDRPGGGPGRPNAGV
ncbi:MAG TPA: hypothetical protein VGA19_11390 [Rhodospirillales bacterium]|jgi:hypothetical protein